ncbi:hypothetical protein LC593_00945 [Nostoc sp. CHAB 5844]|nr:hypothetical protein [Nostoc sp. CHAB 5844]
MITQLAYLSIRARVGLRVKTQILGVKGVTSVRSRTVSAFPPQKTFVPPFAPKAGDRLFVKSQISAGQTMMI